MSIEEQLNSIKETVSSGIIHPDNPFHLEITNRYNELNNQLN